MYLPGPGSDDGLLSAHTIQITDTLRALSPHLPFEVAKHVLVKRMNADKVQVAIGVNTLHLLQKIHSALPGHSNIHDGCIRFQGFEKRDEFLNGGCLTDNLRFRKLLFYCLMNAFQHQRMVGGNKNLFHDLLIAFLEINIPHLTEELNHKNYDNQVEGGIAEGFNDPTAERYTLCPGRS